MSRKLGPGSPRRFVALLVILLALLPAPPAGAGSPEEDRRDVQRRRAELTSEVDALRASDQEVSRALEAIDRDVRAQEGVVADARALTAAAQREVEITRAEQARVQAQVADLRAQAQVLAVDAYTGAQGAGLDMFFEGGSPTDVARERYLLNVAAGNVGQVVDALGAAEEDLALRGAEAEDALAAANASLTELENRLAELDTARNRQAEFALAVDQRLDRALAESANLESLDRELAAEIARRQAELARKTPAATGGSRPRTDGVHTAVVGGIEVDAQIASQIEALLAAAATDGIALSGGGYRSPAAQIETRRRNCGPSDYEIYEMPGSQCSPPTARPGASMHERGLAIDFTSGGAVLSRSTDAYDWLTRNAGRFGLRNLPEEPWHWSTTGT